nr:sulfide/dihydroorotate dehydrogenase-like FAD/NAD-binding protein [Candidatus Njordarchaeum guaymaensis]
MYKVISNQALAPDIKRIVIRAPVVARKIQPGQFLVLRLTENGERVPLTQADASPEKGEITIVYQEVGKSTKLLGTLKPGDSVLDLLGPLGVPIELKKYGTIVLLGGGVGIPPLYPKGKALRKYGNYIVSIIGARNKDLLVMEDEMKGISDEFIVTTDDGSKGRKGFVTDALRDILKKEKVDWIITVGPLIMMKNAAIVAKEFGVKIEVSLNPLMLDATGMCGVCRCTVGGEVKFACVHGPMFDGWKVNFDELMRRSRTFIDEEKAAMDLFNKITVPAIPVKGKR